MRGRLLAPSRRLFATAAEVQGQSFDVVVCGTGAAGVACAHYLSRTHRASVLLVDERPPLSLTSAVSTECYRTFFPGSPPMAAFMERSVDLLEDRAAECDNAFNLNRRGYWFVSATKEGAAQHRLAADDTAVAGTGGVRLLAEAGHGIRYRSDVPFGAAALSPSRPAHERSAALLFSGRKAIHEYTSGLPPFLATDASSLLVCSRAGWMSAQQMGMHLLTQARAAGTRTLSPATLRSVASDDRGRVASVALSVPGTSEPLTVRCSAVVNAAGPYAGVVDGIMRAAATPSSPAGPSRPAGAMPVMNELHAKAILRDSRLAVPADAPMVVWSDPIRLPWSDDEAESLTEMGGFEATLAGQLPGGFHLRPYPGQPHSLLMLWEAVHTDIRVPLSPPQPPELRTPLFAELVVRALSRAIPALGGYIGHDGSMAATVSCDGGYYTKAPDNLPLIGPVVGAPRGAYVCSGLSGYGMMASNAAGELLAQHVAGGPLPDAYADKFLPERWESEAYRDGVASGAIGKGYQI
jgi:glycine/D-amino acid oxidase-like deaminating enzyme